MDLTVLLEPALQLDRLSEVLDGMGHEGRLHTIYGWGKADGYFGRLTPYRGSSPDIA